MIGGGMCVSRSIVANTGQPTSAPAKVAAGSVAVVGAVVSAADMAILGTQQVVVAAMIAANCQDNNNEDDAYRGSGNSSSDDCDDCCDGSEEVSSTKSSSSCSPSTASSSTFFEGVEKLLEVWFANSDGNSENSDLRKIPRESLRQMLRQVKCEIISESRNSKLDAYILSESSMFVSKRRFILKTCGTTTTLTCIDNLLQLAKAFAGFDLIEDIFYSRKNFVRPELQLEPHHSFEREVALLDDMFADGAAYCMGTINGDCWYLYALNPLDRYVSGRVDTEPDQTIEILMQDLDPIVMDTFRKGNALNGRDATFKAGIHKILPNMKVDDFLFDPCGYSMNGILTNESADNGLGEYMTIHITPEPEFSYVSFESNITLTSYLEVIQRVLEIFQPGKFVLTIFANRTSMAAKSHKELQDKNFGHWIRKDIQYSQFQNYELTFAHFVRFPS